MPILRDAGQIPPQGVLPQPVLRLFVGNPPREMLIFAGVAIVDWESEGNLKVRREDVIIKLGAKTTARFDRTCSVSLAAIYNTDSDFLFAADDSSVEVGPDGQLELHVKIAVQGDKSVLIRFSYHVQVLSDPLVSKVSGTIRWNQQWGDPTQEAIDQIASMFRVAAGSWVVDPVAGGGFGGNHWQERASTWTTAKPILANGMWAVSYVIENVPLGQRLDVLPDLQRKTLSGGAPGSTPIYNPSRVIELSLAMPSITDVDFEMSFTGGLR